MKLIAPAIQRPARLAITSRMRSRHRLADQRKELAREIGAAPFARAGLHVEGKERIPDAFGQIAAGEPVHADAVRERVLAFAADGLALARRERGEEILERRVAGVLPVELLIVALKEAEFAEKAPFRLGRKGDVHARMRRRIRQSSIRPAARPGAASARMRPGPHQQPPSRSRA